MNTATMTDQQRAEYEHDLYMDKLDRELMTKTDREFAEAERRRDAPLTTADYAEFLWCLWRVPAGLLVITVVYAAVTLILLVAIKLATALVIVAPGLAVLAVLAVINDRH